jgi:WD40 repeat protein
MVKTPGMLINGRYRLVQVIGEGGMGRVWRASDELLGRVVALKELSLPPTLTTEERSVLYKRCVREARSAARLNHRSVVTVHDVLTEDDCPLIVMELVVGRSLADIIRDHGPLPPLKVAEVGVAVLDALSVAHAAGIVHRDVKPSNVIVAEDRVVLTDFGIAGLAGDTILTRPGVLMGTPAFMSPEQARGQAVTPASDLWSIGATLYVSVEGRLPFPGVDFVASLSALLTEDPAPTERAGPLAPLLNGLLRKDPAVRLSAQQASRLLAEVLRPTLSSPPAHSSPPYRTVVSSVEEPTQQQVDTLTIRDKPQRSRSSSLVGHTAAVSSVAFSPDGILLASCSKDATVRIWNVATRTEAAVLPHSWPIAAVAFSPDGKVLAAAGDSTTVQFWNVGPRPRRSALESDHTEKINTVAFSPNGKLLATGSNDGTVQLRDIATPRWSGMRKGTRVLHSGDETSFVSVAFSPDGQSLAAANSDMSAWVWNFGNPSSAFLGWRLWHHSSVTDVAFSPDGNTLATCSWVNGSVRLWDVATGMEIVTLRNDVSAFAATFSPDGNFLATGGADKVVRLWDVATREQVGEPLVGHTDDVESIDFSPDGTLLATGSHDRVVRLWETI